jgi:hypothetical protein
MTTLTPLETLTLKTIKEYGDDWDGRQTMHFDDIVEQSQIPAKQLRGVVSSLDKKCIIIEDEMSTTTSWTIL